MKKYIIIILLLLLYSLSFGQYVDKTPALQVNAVNNIYQTTGGDVRSGFDWFCTYAEYAWGGIGLEFTGAIGVFDSLNDYTDANPDLAREWSWYSNANQCVYEDKLYLACMDVFDSIALDDGGSDTLINEDVQRNDLFIKVADDSTLFLAESVTEHDPSDALWLIDDDTPTSSTLGTSETTLKDGNRSQYIKDPGDTDDWSIGIDFSAAKGRLYQLRIYDSTSGDEAMYASTNNAIQVYASDDNSTWTLMQTFDPVSRDSVGPYFYINCTMTLPYASNNQLWRYWKATCSDGVLKNTGGTNLRLSEVEVYGDVRMLYSVALSGADSLSRFPIFSGGVWGADMDVNGVVHEHLFQLDNDTVAQIVALGILKNLNSSSTYLPDVDQLLNMGIDNMLIGLTEGGCYGLNQASYWTSYQVGDWGGTYGTDVEWSRIGRAKVSDDFCDMKPGYYKVVEYICDYFEPFNYRVALNISNTSAANLSGYLQVGNDSILRVGGELRGNDLSYYASDDNNFNYVLDNIDTVANYPKMKFNIEYRIEMNSAYDGDLYNPPNYPNSTTIESGERIAEKIFGCQLWCQDWNTNS